VLKVPLKPTNQPTMCTVYSVLCVTIFSCYLCIQEASLNPLCRRLALKELLPSAWQRLTKYPLLIEKLLLHTCVFHWYCLLFTLTLLFQTWISSVINLDVYRFLQCFVTTDATA